MVTQNELESQDGLTSEKFIDFSIKMRDAALLSAERRQAYEWKFCILIWTAIGSIIVTLLIKKTVVLPKYEEALVIGLVFLSLIVMIIVFYFQKYCGLANQVDKRRAELYEAVINASMGIAGSDYEDLYADSKVGYDKNQNCNQAIKICQAKRIQVKEAIGKVDKKKGKWSRNSQITITFVLIATFWVLCILIIFPKPSGESSEASINTTNQHMEQTGISSGKKPNR